MKPAIFISFEGIEGAGKSTVLECLKQHSVSHGWNVRFTREPGGTALGEALREVLLHQPLGTVEPYAELLMICAARAQHLHEVILPTLSQGQHVISDRYRDSTVAYQMGGRQMDESVLHALEAHWPHFHMPHHTLYFDVTWEESIKRRQGRQADRFESESRRFFERVRERYLRLVEDEPNRVVLIDTMRPIQEVVSETMGYIVQWI